MKVLVKPCCHNDDFQLPLTISWTYEKRVGSGIPIEKVLGTGRSKKKSLAALQNDLQKYKDLETSPCKAQEA